MFYNNAILSGLKNNAEGFYEDTALFYNNAILSGLKSNAEGMALL